MDVGSDEHGGSDHRVGTREVAGPSLSISGEVTSLPSRKIREDTCQHWGYRVGKHGGKTAQLAYYYDDQRRPIAVKVRFANKDMLFLGDTKNAPLYGQWLWRGSGKKLVITEGEIDALTVSQLQSNKWPVVSIPTGCKGAVKAIKKSLEWVSSFEEVIFMFDMDEPGQAAAKACAELLPPGKAKIAQLPFKDPNECLKQGKGDEVINAMWNAKTYRPDGVINGADLWDKLNEVQTATSVPYPWPALNEKTHGIRQGELITITAGSGIGKSAVVREIAYDLIQKGETVGMIMLEESVERTALGLMGLDLDKPIHLNRELASGEEQRRAFENTVGSGRVYLYDHFGSTEIGNLLSRVRYLARSCDCRWIILDHLSIVVSGLEGDDERRLIDRAMTMLRTLVQETGIGLILVSHLKRPEGKGHEEGAATSLSQLRGSHSIAQLSDMVLGLERAQQGENPNQTTVRILKNRFSGETGVAATLFYSQETGRLTEVEPVYEPSEPMEF